MAVSEKLITFTKKFVSIGEKYLSDYYERLEKHIPKIGKYGKTAKVIAEVFEPVLTKPGKRFLEKTVAHVGTTYNRKKVKALTVLLFAFKKNEPAARKALVQAGVEIFQSFESQFVQITADESWGMAMEKLAHDAFNRFINYAMENTESEVEIPHSFILKGVIKGKSKDKDPFHRGHNIKFGSIKMTTEQLFEQVGFVIIKDDGTPDKYYRSKHSKSPDCGYRILFNHESIDQVECTEDPTPKTVYKYTLSDQDVEKLKNELLDSINKEDRSPIEESTTKETLDRIMERIESCLTFLKDRKDESPNQSPQKIKEPISFDVRDVVALFVERNSKLKEIAEHIKQKIVVINGLGGVGKSELAVKYAHQHKSENKSVIWINAETYETASKSFYDLLKVLQIPTKDYEKDVKTAKVMANESYAFFEGKETLFIFDNADEHSIIEMLPINMQAYHIIITSQNNNLLVNKREHAVVELDTLPADGAVQFVKKSLKIESNAQDQDIEELVDILGCLPLALQHAVAYIENSGFVNNIREYVQSYRNTQQEKELLLNRERLGTHQHTIFLTFQTAIGKVKPDALAEDILNIIAYFASENIPKDLFLKLALDKIQPENPSNRTDQACGMLTRTLKSLKMYSIINLVEDEISIHRLVQDSIRIALKQDEAETILTQALSLLKEYIQQGDAKWCEPHLISLKNHEDLIFKNRNDKKSTQSSYQRVKGKGKVRQLEINLSILLLLKGTITEEITDFCMASNMFEAKFADMVLSYQYQTRKPKMAFLHFPGEQFKVNSLFPSSEDFSLNKYFNAFCNIKQKFSTIKDSPHSVFSCNFLDSQFIIYTNASFPNDKKDFVKEVNNEIELLEMTNQQAKCYQIQFNDSISTLLKNSSKCETLAEELANAAFQLKKPGQNEIFSSYNNALFRKVIEKIDNEVESELSTLSAVVHNSDLLQITDSQGKLFHLKLGSDRKTKILSHFENTLESKKLVEELAQAVVPLEKSDKDILTNAIQIKLGKNVKNNATCLGKLRSEFLDGGKGLSSRDEKFRMVFLEKAANISGKTGEEMMCALKKAELKLPVNFFDNKAKGLSELPNNDFIDDDIKDFLNQVRLYASQPSENELKEIAKKTAKEFYKVKQHDIHGVFDNVASRVDNWWRTGSNYLTKFSNIFELAAGVSVAFDLIKPVRPFTGRVKELEYLHQNLQDESNASKIVCVVGLGGVGKSELARKFLNDKRENYDNNLIWINATNISLIKKSFRQLAKNHLRIKITDNKEENKDMELLVKEVYGFFEKRERKSMFVFDNAQRQDIIGEGQAFLPVGFKYSYVLITSRDQDWCDIKTLKLNEFSEGEASEFIDRKLSYVTISEEGEINDLAAKLKFLPLALNQAVFHIEKENYRLNKWSEKKGAYTISNYLDEFETTSEKLSIPESNTTHGIYYKTIMTAWKITSSKLKIAEGHRGKQAQKMLDVMVYLSPDNICVNEIFLKQIPNEEDRHQAVGLLVEYSIASLQGGMVNIHGLFQEMRRMELEEEGENKSVIKEAFTLLRARLLNSEKITKALWSHLESFISHVEGVLKTGERNVNRQNKFSKFLKLVAHKCKHKKERQKELLDRAKAWKITNTNEK